MNLLLTILLGNIVSSVSLSFGIWTVLFALILCVAAFLYNRKQKEQLARTINNRIDQIWNLYNLQFSLEKRRDVYQRIFCNNSLLYYFQQMYGYCHSLRVHEDSDERIKMTFENRILNGIYNVILAQTVASGNSFEIPHDFTPTLSKSAYFMSSNIDINNLQYSKALLDQLNQRQDELKTVEMQKKKQFNLYEILWNECLPYLEKLVRIHLSNLNDYVESGSIKRIIEEITESMTAILRSNDISLLFRSESKIAESDDLFLTIDDGFELPLVIRNSDGYVYYKGKTFN